MPIPFGRDGRYQCDPVHLLFSGEEIIRGKKKFFSFQIHDERLLPSASNKQKLPPTHSLSLLYRTPIIFPLLNRARLLAALGRFHPSFHKYIMRNSAFAGSSG